jgi:hypothetical protein
MSHRKKSAWTIGAWSKTLTPEQRTAHAKKAAAASALKVYGPKRIAPPKTASGVWCWPERLAAYDRRTELSDNEKATLTAYVAKY